jgi:hypothetical protein
LPVINRNLQSEIQWLLACKTPKRRRSHAHPAQFIVTGKPPNIIGYVTTLPFLLGAHRWTLQQVLLTLRAIF